MELYGGQRAGRAVPPGARGEYLGHHQGREKKILVRMLYAGVSGVWGLLWLLLLSLAMLLTATVVVPEAVGCGGSVLV